MRFLRAAATPVAACRGSFPPATIAPSLRLKSHSFFQHHQRRGVLSVGIRKEGKNRWERRVPLIPEHVERLVNEFGVKVYVQPSTKRVIPDEKYKE
ncbi:hypothetical protein HK102_010918, partial [Quaeritorhiza haematococci]